MVAYLLRRKTDLGPCAWFALAILLVACVAQLGLAAETKPNTLAPEEIAGGWILLFDGETTFGWENHGGAQFQAKEGILVGQSGSDGWAGTTTEFADFILKLQYRIDEKGNSGIFFRSDHGERPWESGYEMQIWDKDEKNPTGSIYAVAKADHGGKLLTGVGNWNDVTITAQGDRVQVELNGKKVLETRLPSDRHAQAPRGVMGIQYHYPGMKIEFRNLKLKPLGLQHIFNGKDLTGWKVVEGHKSIFRVTKEGYLNVKDGNGQIETEGTWDDFALQLDIISNGDHLNSGVFFRGDANGFWTGYESQVRNEWLTDLILKDGAKHSGSYVAKGDTITLQICELDGARVRPTNQKLTLKKSDVKEVIHHRDQPVDFGTGGIYNQQPARKVVPDDGHWYTKTIVAHGNHMAVWVNGYQASDFTDRRPRGTNARTQQRLEAGTISLQGHDPTTDLSFRNINLAPLPKRAQ